jgi:hypothetical protein
VQGIALMKEIAEQAKKGGLRDDNCQSGRRKRILLTRVPVGLGNEKVVKLLSKAVRISWLSKAVRVTNSRLSSTRKKILWIP